MWHSIYFLTYALVATISAIVIAWAQYVRYKRDGTPFNFTLLTVVIFAALAMWIGASFTIFAYERTTVAAGVGAFLLGLSFSILLAWQVNKVFRNIEKDKKVIKELSTQDALTGLWNRRIFHESLDREYERSVRFNQPLTLMMYEIDKLGEINEKYGFKSGDMVLMELGERFSQSVSTIRSIDIACRFRGDKLAVIFPQTESYEAQVVAKRVQELVTEKPFDIGQGDPLRVTVSMGIASLGKNIESEDDLIAGTLGALEASEKHEGNCINVLTEEGEYREI